MNIFSSVEMREEQQGAWNEGGTTRCMGGQAYGQERGYVNYN